jgi:phospholipid transport system substrate-binding protein
MRKISTILRKKKSSRFAALVVCGIATAAAPLWAENTPRGVVQETGDAGLAVLRDKNLSSAEKRTKIEELVYARVDFEILCRLVLAKNWGRLTDPQKEEFSREFKRHLSVTYGNNIDNYKNETFKIIGERKETRGDYIVNSKVIRGGPDDIAVDYRLRQRDRRRNQSGVQLPLAVPGDHRQRRRRASAAAAAREKRQGRTVEELTSSFESRVSSFGFARHSSLKPATR